MDPLNSGEFALPLLDWIVIAVLLAGLVGGALAGLARSFGMLLWMVAALWLGHHLSGHVVDWMPNTADPADPVATANLRQLAFGVIAALVLLIPVLARVVGGAAGKKKEGEAAQHKPFGALVGLVVATLFVTLALPFADRLGPLQESYTRANAPDMAAEFADNLTYLFPPAHRQALRAR